MRWKDYAMKVAVLVVLVSLSVSVGLWVPAMAQERDFRPPSATEVFNLRSRCAELGENILDQQPFKSRTFPSQVSRYDPRTNRCYVELTVLTDDINTLHRYLYDGQTKEMLAHAARVKGNMEGQIFNNERNPTGIAGYF
jgi:hypothetical protein